MLLRGVSICDHAVNIKNRKRVSDWREARSEGIVLLTTLLAVVGLIVAATGGAVALQEGSGSADFGQNVYTADRGDTASITIEFSNTDTATVQIGDPDNNAYHVTAQVEDQDGDGEATVTFDSETAGSDQQVLAASDGDAVTSVTQGGPFDGMNDPAGSDILAAAQYTLYVTAGEKSSDQIGDPDARA